MNLLIQKVSRSKRVQAIGTMIVMSVMLINPFLQIPLSATQAAQAKSTVPASSQSPQCSEVMMYAISDEGTDDSYFLAFNTNTGQGGVVNYKDNYDIEAIDIHPQTGVIYGLAGDSNDVSDVKRLLTIDPVSGIPDLSTGVDLHLSEGQEYRGMSFNPTTGELWATGDNVELVTIDINTGVATQKYNVSGDPDGLAWNTDGTILYVLYENGKLYTYNGSSMSLSCSGLGKAEGLEMDPNGNLVIGYHNNNSIYTEFVNPATCATTPATEYNANYEDIETITFACLDVPENPICGNGIKETGEQCDDGNVVNGDGCSNQCTIDALVCTDQTMYFISDKSSGNSYFVKYNTATQNETFINYKNQYDIEAIDIDPVSNKIYALAGDNKGSNDYKKLLVLDRGTGIPDISTGIDLGLVDEQEYQGMSFNPVTGELWAAGRDVELVTINLTTGTATEKKNIQGGADALAWDNAGENLYLLYENDRLDRYQNGTIQTMCTNVEGATGMEFEPNGNMLIIGYTGGNVWTEIMDPNTCTRVAHTSHTSTYKDVETLTSECTPAQYCGNGILETGEACDEGTNNGSLTCSEQCTIPVGTIAGCKYADANNNGVIDSGETKLADWTIILSKNGTEVARTTTNENGCYAFTDVALATYTVSEEQQTGWQQTYPSTNNGIHTVEFTAPQTIANIDFANYEVPVNTTYCGDGVVQNPNDNGQNELCDEGANNGNICSPDYGNSCSYCSTTCQPVDVEGPYCGDGQLDTNHEQCDDGNNQDGDGCSATCTTEDFACELELTKVVDKTTAGLGDTVNYTVQVKNVGDADCTNVTLTDTFPGGVAIVDSTPTPTSGSTVWNVGTLTPNQTATVTMVGEIEKNNTLCESTLTNSVVAVADDVDQTDPATASTAICVNHHKVNVV